MLAAQMALADFVQQKITETNETYDADAKANARKITTTALASMKNQLDAYYIKMLVTFNEAKEYRDVIWCEFVREYKKSVIEQAKT